MRVLEAEDRGKSAGEGPENRATSSGSGGGLLAMPYPKFLMLGALLTQIIGGVLFGGATLTNMIYLAPIMAPVILLCALAVWKGKPWMYLAGGLALLVLPLLAASFALALFVTPQLGIIFIGGTLLLLSLFLGLPTSVWVFRHRQAMPSPQRAREGLRTRHGLLTVMIGGLVLGSILTSAAAYLVATAGVTNLGADFEPEVNVTVTAENYMFSPKTVQIPVGKVVEVTVLNKDSDFHTFTYTLNKGTPQEKTYSHNLLPSSAIKFTTVISTAGTVRFWCIPHEAMGMVGDFVVT